MTKRTTTAIVIAFAMLLAACGASAREKTLKATYVTLTTAADAFVIIDKAKQMDIVKNSTSEADGITKLAAYRARRAVVETAFSVAFRALAVAAIEKKDSTRYANALLFVGEAVRLFNDLKGALQ